jgi:glycosyltransferase involved in cell wall biosynthesis
MPLADDAFTRGKCAFKLLQYMAASLACIASPVGANVDVVTPGVNGLLADSPADWVAAFDRLLTQRPLRDAMGLAGRERVLCDYDSRVVIPRAASLVEALVGRGGAQPLTGRSTNSISDA